MTDKTYILKLSKTFTAQLVREGSWGSSALGEHESTMELVIHSDLTGYIEWDIPSIDTVEEIGLTFELDADRNLVLTDYDGVFSLPAPAIELLREAKVIVTEEFE